MDETGETVTKKSEDFENDLEILRIDPTRKRMSPAPGHFVLGGALVALVGFLGVAGVWKGPIEVEVARPVRLQSSVPTTVLTAGGYIVPHRKIELSSKITARIEWIGVDRGDRVKTGQVLIRLDQRDYRAQVEQAQSRLQAAEARLKELLAGSRTEEIEEARAAVEQARSNLTMARLNLDRMRRLVEEGLIARQLFDEAQNQYETAQARLKAVQERFQLLRAGPRAEQIDFARAEVSGAQATLELAAANLENTLIWAPIDGTILERLAEVGETVTTSIVSQRGAKSAVLSLADLSDLQVDVDVNQAELKKLRLKMAAVVILDAYPDRTYQGFLTEIASEANRQKATLGVKVQIRSPDRFIRPEMAARVHFQEPPGRAGGRRRVLVPKAAVVTRGEARVVYAVLDGKVIERRVMPGAEAGENIEVLEGLTGDETVVVRGAASLTDGQSVRTKRSS